MVTQYNTIQKQFNSISTKKNNANKVSTVLFSSRAMQYSESCTSWAHYIKVIKRLNPATSLRLLWYCTQSLLYCELQYILHSRCLKFLLGKSLVVWGANYFIVFIKKFFASGKKIFVAGDKNLCSKYKHRVKDMIICMLQALT